MEIIINLIQEERQKHIAAFQNTNSLSLPCSGSWQDDFHGLHEPNSFPLASWWVQWENQPDTEEQKETEMGTLPGSFPAEPSLDGLMVAEFLPQGHSSCYEPFS